MTRLVSTSKKTFEDSMVMVVVMMVVRVKHILIHIVASCYSRIEHDEVSVCTYVHSTVQIHDTIFVHSLV